MPPSVAPGGLLLSSVDSTLFVRPLDHLAAENVRLLRVCAQIEIIILNATRLVHPSLPVLVPYLRWDFPRHLEWLERWFFPQLEASCYVGDPIQELAAQLVLEQGLDRRKASHLAGLLAQFGQAPQEGLEQCLILAGDAFADAQKRHVSWLELSVLPLAHARLSQQHLQELARGLAAHYS